MAGEKGKRRKFDIKFKKEVLKYAEEHSGEATVRHFSIDPKCIRYWKKQKQELAVASGKKARLAGGGRKKVSEELDAKLVEWIHSMRGQHNRVTRKMIKRKAMEIYPTVNDGGARFNASNGWLQKFMKRAGMTVRRRTTMAQKDPDQLTENLVSFVDYVGKAVVSNKILEKDIIAMNETAVWFDMVSPTTVDNRGTSAVALKTTGHEKSHLTVVLAAKADGTNLKPFIVFKGAVREVKAMQQDNTKAVIATSANGWMNDDLTIQWLKSVVGKFSFRPRLLVWDSYRCHISACTKAELKTGYKITTAVIPGGCTKYIQAPDVMWNQPFKAHLHAAYDEWIAGVADKTYTAGGNLRAPARRLLVSWVLAAWDELDTDLIIKSFKVCGKSLKSDVTEEDFILRFR